MQLGEIWTRRRGDDCYRIELLAIRSDPGFGKSGEAERLPVAAVDEIGPLAIIGNVPFVIAVGGNEAAASLDRILECGLLTHRLRPCIDEERERPGILDPGRQHPPTHQPKMPVIIFDNYHRYRLGRRDIEPRWKVGLLGIGK